MRISLNGRNRLAPALVALLASLAIGIGIWRLEADRAGLTITAAQAGTTPVVLFEPPSPATAPVVVIAHGFAGAQQLMQPFAVTLARNGYRVITFDFPGHGRNTTPMPGGLAAEQGRSAALLGALADVVALARGLPGAGPTIALLGHSMGADLVARHAMADPDIAATIGVSLYSVGITATAPRNLLTIVGALEPAMLRDEARRLVAMATPGEVRDRTTYGDPAAGTARRLVVAGSVEHIGVLYSAQSLDEARAWLDLVFNRTGTGFIDHRAPWLGLLFAGLVALAWPLAHLLPRLEPIPMGARLDFWPMLAALLAPPLLTPLILWKLPTDFLPVLLGDYLCVHFALYGTLTAAAMWLAGVRVRLSAAPLQLALPVAAVAAYSILALGLPIDRYLTGYMPGGLRWAVILAMLAGTVPYFVAEEWLTRSGRWSRLRHVAAKLAYLVSLGLAVTLDPPRLFFLIIIIPVMLVFLAIFGLFATWAHQRTNQPMVGALANATAFAWAIAVTFPLVAR